MQLAFKALVLDLDLSCRFPALNGCQTDGTLLMLNFRTNVT